MIPKVIRRNWNSIAISLGVGILMFYAQPLLALVGTEFVTLCVSMSKRFASYYFTLVARNDPNLISNYVAMIVVILFWLVSSSFITEPYLEILGLERKLKQIEQELNGTEDQKTEQEDAKSRLA